MGEVARFLLELGAVAVLAVMAGIVDRNYRHDGATVVARLVQWLLAAGIVLSALFSPQGTGWPVLVCLGLWIGAMAGPTVVISLTGGAIPLVRMSSRVIALLAACRHFRDLAPTADAESNQRMIRAELSELESFRTPLTAEYIDLMRESVESLIARKPWPEGRVKRERLYDLEETFRATLDRQGVGTSAWRWDRRGRTAFA